MSSKKIAIIPGDGIGPEVTAAAREILTLAARKAGLDLEYATCLAGGAAIDATGVPLPDDTLAAAKTADAVLLGAVGGPKWDTVAPDIRPEKAILGLRKALGLYANLRPVKVSAALAAYSPLKPEIVTGTDILIVRELTGGIYFGPKCESETADGVERAWDTEIYSVPEVARIVRMACKAAKGRRGRVTSVDKANVLASSRLWRRVASAIAQEEGTELSHMYVDNCAMQLVLGPKTFDVIVTGNLFGDILSDEAAVVAGSIGLLPSASIGDGPGLYEPIHGSAPDIAGQGIANPVGTILSAAMLLRHSLRAEAPAAAVEQAVDAVLAEGYRTADLYRPGLTKVSTEEMGKLIIKQL
ncbi:3-isopropylmalate dehydrogenase [Anaeroselena agilis]|uniref:3-isopropylmalate dehydrogenase n=1 Tax=Anaeroselena agilis TaxID=3063788 RepID=A0ABU3P369_9FIRM|nr:3-isopropylmalate dehydrogenase [Selenomonadales bacterium 4137-cl]